MAKGVRQKHYTGEFKQQVVETMWTERLGYCETARRFQISSNHRVASWERIYQEEGVDGLYRERRGRPRGSCGIRAEQKPQLDKKAERDLAAENQRLRAENDYLKKLNALVSQRVQQEKKHRWSGN